MAISDVFFNLQLSDMILYNFSFLVFGCILLLLSKRLNNVAFLNRATLRKHLKCGVKGLVLFVVIDGYRKTS